MRPEYLLVDFMFPRLVEKAQAGDPHAAEGVYITLRRLVVKIAWGYHKHTSMIDGRRLKYPEGVGRPADYVLGFEDKEQAGYLGVAIALQRFDPSQGVPFGVYAAPQIKGAITALVRANEKFEVRQRGLRDRDERKRVRGLLSDLSTPTETPLGHLLDDEETIRQVARVRIVRYALILLDPKEQQAIRLLYLDTERLNKTKIAKQIGVSRPTLDAIEDRALGKLRRLVARTEHQPTSRRLK